MGLTIHYKGQLRPGTDIGALVDELFDFAQQLDWKYTVLHDERVHGIVLNPGHNCESVWMVFTPEGRLVQPIWLARGETDEDFLYQLWTKTQFAGEEMHMAIVKLLHYLDDRYFETFEVYDEGEYWESGDPERLKTIFGRFRFALNTLAKALEAMPLGEEESPESLTAQIEKWLSTHLPGATIRSVKRNEEGD
jgi:hypothetical protein